MFIYKQVLFKKISVSKYRLGHKHIYPVSISKSHLNLVPALDHQDSTPSLVPTFLYFSAALYEKSEMMEQNRWNATRDVEAVYLQTASASTPIASA